MPVSLVTPSTRPATSSPNASRTSSSDAVVSSTVSCSSAAHSVSVSSRMPAQIFATPTGWTMKSSPDLRRWSAWCSQAKTNAFSSSRRSTGVDRLVGVLGDDREQVGEQLALERRQVGRRLARRVGRVAPRRPSARPRGARRSAPASRRPAPAGRRSGGRRPVAPARGRQASRGPPRSRLRYGDERARTLQVVRSGRRARAAGAARAVERGEAELGEDADEAAGDGRRARLRAVAAQRLALARRAPVARRAR